ncbi:MAG: AIR Synthase, TMP kinase, hydrogenase maturation protein HypE superfamily [Firmicutes bacterium]|nr:AIR Synthase, TMP kinase, hydrogenase maturation protein HypE superfamily [Bacillota bacterium]MDI6707050.1 AIR synthase family protein [Bacillota bacterium]
MKSGKLPSDVLESKIFTNFKFQRKEVLVRPKVGEDCSVLDFGEYACVVSTDPITGASNEVGRLAVHISCNDVAANGVEPIGLLMTIMAPEGTTVEEIQEVVRQASEEAEMLNVEIIGGHTEITASVNRMVVSTTAIGRAPRDRIINSSGARPGDRILMTKWAGLEGTAIIAYDLADRLEARLGRDVLEEARGLMKHISVVKEGIIGGKMGATAMHDVTEGGVLGALWEIAEASDVGLRVFRDRIPLKRETRIICEELGLDPLKLISSGCMIIVCRNSDEMEKALKEQGIRVADIGEITARERVLVEGDIEIPIEAPGTDELYKVI